MHTCDQCNKEFLTSPYEKNGTCSKKCNANKMKMLYTKSKECPVCNTSFNYDERKPRVVCSRKCANEYQKNSTVVENKKKKTIQTLQQKYGVQHNSQIKSFTEKRKQTLLSRYGNQNYTNREKAKQTLLTRYGSESYVNTKKIQDSMKSKYGVKAFSQSTKFKEIMQEKYGVTHPLHIHKNKVSQFEKVISKLKTITPNFTFDSYVGVKGGSLYPFTCNVCSAQFESSLDDGNIPICRTCHPIDTSKSKLEFQMIDWIRTFYNGTIIHGDKEILNGKELDIYLPEINVAIEINGIYYHGELSGGKGKNYHLNKTRRCAEKGITLCHVLDIELIQKKSIVESILRNKICPSELSTIHGRQCSVREVAAPESNTFLNENHIQGEDKSSVRIGLFHGDKMVSLMTFGRNRFGKYPEWEMYRFCNRLHTNVRGSLEKLFKYFIHKHNPSSIVSFADRRYFNGNSYTRVGFKLVDTTQPNYHYFKVSNHKTIFTSRNQFQKHKLKDKLETFDSSLTEWNNMQLNGYDRIWDCGNYKWIWIP
jgi:hypothetical protein